MKCLTFTNLEPMINAGALSVQGVCSSISTWKIEQSDYPETYLEWLYLLSQVGVTH